MSERSLLGREGHRIVANEGAEGLVTRPATELVALLRSGEVSPTELMEEFLARVDVAHDAVNPFSFRFPAEAREAARVSAQRLRTDPANAGALEGVPVAIKELTPVAGHPHTLGSLALKDNIAARTDPAVERLRRAGAIIHVRTNTPEFGCASFTDNLLFGETVNPWNTAMSTAGSSGGAAAALATYATPLAQGTDSAGSLRLPAAACGVVGMKPSQGAVPLSRPQYLEPYNHNGPMARNVPDLRLMYDVMAGYDPSLLAGVRIDRSAPVSIRGLRVGLIDAMADVDVHPDVTANLHRAAVALEGAGAVVEPVSFPWSFSFLFETAKMVFAHTYAPQARLLMDAGAPLADYTRAFVSDMRPFMADLSTSLTARDRVGEMHAVMGALMGSYDLLLLPTLADPAPVAGDHFIDHGPMVNGVEQLDRWIVAFTVPFNLVSTLPVLQLPTGLSRDGIPTGAQLVGRPSQDYSVMSVAEQLEVMLDA